VIFVPGSLLSLTRAQVREVDRRAIADYGIPGIVLMENAGRSAADVIRQLYATHCKADDTVAIVTGRGNNGGDGFVIARHLHNAGLPVALFPAAPLDSLSGDAETQACIAVSMKLPMFAFDDDETIGQHSSRLQQAAIIVDAVLGTGFAGDVRPPLDRVIHNINAAPAAIRVAIDVPSGLDCDTGRPSNATVRAHHTITFVARKIGFDQAGAAEFTGQVHVADIGAPPEILQSVLSR